VLVSEVQCEHHIEARCYRIEENNDSTDRDCQKDRKGKSTICGS
jgi:hypothetical protein